MSALMILNGWLSADSSFVEWCVISLFLTQKIPHEMTCGVVSIQGWLFDEGKNDKERQT